MTSAADAIPPIKKLNLATSIVLILFHAGALAAVFFFDWKAVAVAVMLYWIACGLGIGTCYHRLLTHRSYKTSKFVEYVLTVCGTLTLEGGPIFWVATHRLHHQLSDRPGDPHTPRDGAWWAHVGWIVFGETMHNNTRIMSRFAPDLGKDRFHVWLSNYHYVPVVLLGLLLLAAGGWPMVLWALCLRTVLGLHATWLVNSATHMWGKRRFATRDDSRNSWWVALLTFGEGWHNNHHAHPTSARHGLAWYEFDMNWIHIRTMQILGLATAVQTAKVTQAMSSEAA
jgi:stearoyl-CoA desaturase (delta-9 desaturase)